MNPTRPQLYQEIVDLLSVFFDSTYKAEAWMETKNLLLGDVTPKELLLMSKGEKLLRFVKVALEEDVAQTETKTVTGPRCKTCGRSLPPDSECAHCRILKGEI